MKYFVALIILCAGMPAFSEDDSKVQKVNFSAADIDGKVRSPEGSYLVQKRGVDFVPLYKVKQKFKSNVKDSLEYIQ